MPFSKIEKYVLISKTINKIDNKELLNNNSSKNDLNIIKPEITNITSTIQLLKNNIQTSNTNHINNNNIKIYELNRSQLIINILLIENIKVLTLLIL